MLPTSPGIFTRLAFNVTAASLLFGVSAAQQQLDVRDIRPIPVEVKRAGNFDWTQKRWRSHVRPEGASCATIMVYDNTCTWTGGGFYGGFSECEDVIADGRIPGGVGGGNPPGSTTDNLINSFQFGYCTTAITGAVDIKIGFYDTLGGTCLNGIAATPPSLSSQANAYFDFGAVAGFPLPGSATSGTLACAIVDITNVGFCLQSDGDGFFDNVGALDNFNWSYEGETPIAGTTASGLILAGEPSTSPVGGCTYNIPCGTDINTLTPCGHGLGQNDAFWINVDGDLPGDTTNTGVLCNGAAGAGSNCYWYGGHPANSYSGFWMKMGSAGACAGCDAIMPGSDLWNTPGLGCTYQEFPNGSLASDFFGVGGNPWPGGGSMFIGFVGTPLTGTGMVGNVDTIVERLAPANLGGCGTQDTVPIQIKALSLESFKPVRVAFSSGGPALYHVTACLENVAQPLGSMTIRREHANGGTFDSTLPVIARLTFTKVSGTNGVASATLPGALITFQNPGSSGVSACWSYDDGGLGIPSSPGGSGVDCAGNAFTFPATSNFYGGVCYPGADCINPGGPAEPNLTRENALLAQHCILPVALPPQTTGYCYCGPTQPPGAPCGNFDPNAGCINSTGQGMRLDVVGPTTVTPDTAVFNATGGPPNVPGMLMWSTGATFGHFGDGHLCVSQPRRTQPVNMGFAGAATWTNVSVISMVPLVGGIRTYQVWYRDVTGPCFQGSNLSNAYQVLWLP